MRSHPFVGALIIMLRAITLIALAMASLLAACSGQAKPLIVCLQPSDHIEAMRGCDGAILPTNETDPVKSVAAQALLGDNVILFIGLDRASAIANFETLISEAKKYPGIKYIYLKDELFWCSTGACIGKDEDLVIEAARIAHAAGLKTIITINPQVALDKTFRLKEPSAFDVVALDVYFSMLDPSLDRQGCVPDSNLQIAEFTCSVQRVRAQGFTGAIALLYQGFGLTSMSESELFASLQMQRQLIDRAASLGASAVMAYGCYLGPDALEREPNLVPLCDTKYAAMVAP